MRSKELGIIWNNNDLRIQLKLQEQNITVLENIDMKMASAK